MAIKVVFECSNCGDTALRSDATPPEDWIEVGVRWAATQRAPMAGVSHADSAVYYVCPRSGCMQAFQDKLKHLDDYRYSTQQ